MNKNVVIKINYVHDLTKHEYQLMIVMLSNNIDDICHEIQQRVSDISKFTVLSVHIQY